VIISRATLAILKNYNGINTSMVINKGSQQNVVSTTKTVMSTVEIEEDFPVKFGIFDMGQFLNILTSFDEPTLEFHDKYVKITKENQVIKYRYSEPSLITTLSEEAIDKLNKHIKPDCSFTLSKEVLKKLQDIVSILRAEYVMFEGNGESIFIKTFNPKDESDTSFSVENGETDSKFRMIFKFEHLKVLPGDYAVTISRNKLLKFTHSQVALNYIIPCEKDSTFE